MNTINIVNDRRFSLNDTEYLKNYVTEVRGNNISIFNCYESKDVLVELSHYSQFKVKGLTYSSAKALQVALLDVLYSRNTLGGDNHDYAFEQNNVGKIYELGFFEKVDNLYTAIVNLVNSYYTLNLTEKDTPAILTIFKSERPYWAPASGPFNGTMRPVAKHGFLFLGGKGTWGLNGATITADMLYALPAENLTVNDIESNPSTQVINFGAITNQTVLQWLNTRMPGLAIQSQDDGYTLFKGTIDGMLKSYLWVGTAGIYGAGSTQSIANDFQELSGESLQVGSVHRPVKVINENTAGFENGTYTLRLDDKDKWLTFNVGSNFTVRIPAFIFPANTLLEGDSTGNGQATFVAGSGATLTHPPSEMPKTAEKNSVFALKFRTATDISLYGRLELL